MFTEDSTDHHALIGLFLNNEHIKKISFCSKFWFMYKPLIFEPFLCQGVPKETLDHYLQLELSDQNNT